MIGDVQQIRRPLTDALMLIFRRVVPNLLGVFKDQDLRKEIRCESASDHAYNTKSVKNKNLCFNSLLIYPFY